jgi:hypothetical protein
MDVSFDEWVCNDARSQCVKKWADSLIHLGTTWNSFRLDDDEGIFQDLVNAGGIPLLEKRDIVRIAKHMIEKSEAPMAIVWDLKTMPILVDTTGRDVVSRLKTTLQPFERLTRLRGYTSVILNHIPQQKQYDLRLSGCHLADFPHNSRKELTDKKITVDAMKFAFLNPRSAALCFIPGDVDYAYLLSVLQRPERRTIVISKRSISSMFHVHCDMRMCWETDILLLLPAMTVAPKEFSRGHFKVLVDEERNVEKRRRIEYNVNVDSVTQSETATIQTNQAICTLRSVNAQEALKDLRQMSMATAKAIPITIPEGPSLRPISPCTDDSKRDREKDGSDDEVSEWDGEHKDSAEIDARLGLQTG